MLATAGRLWRGMEMFCGELLWPQSYRALLISAPQGADWMDPSVWEASEAVQFTRQVGGAHIAMQTRAGCGPYTILAVISGLAGLVSAYGGRHACHCSAAIRACGQRARGGCSCPAVKSSAQEPSSPVRLQHSGFLPRRSHEDSSWVTDPAGI